MSGRVFVTGASGFVGSAVIKELLARGYRIDALVHRRPLQVEGNVHQVNADLFDVSALAQAMRGCDAVIHLVGIIQERRSRGVTFQRMHYEASRSVIDAAKSAGVRRFVHMSALGVRQDAIANYHRTKWQAEEYLRGSGLDWTILRPSLIHGRGGEFMQMEASWARGRQPPFLFMPYFGAGVFGRGGAGKLQPIAVEDVARAFVDCLEKPKTIGEVYLLGGPDELTWPQLHRISACAIIGRERWVNPMPAWVAKLVSRVVPAPLLPFNRDQVIMSQEDNTCDLGKFVAHFSWTPRPFEPSLQEYAKSI